MEEWSPFRLDKMGREILDLFLKYGYGDVKMYENSYFTTHLTDETACMTLQEFSDKCWVED